MRGPFPRSRAPAGSGGRARPRRARAALITALVLLAAPAVAALLFWPQTGGGLPVLGRLYAVGLEITVTIQVCLWLADAFLLPRLRPDRAVEGAADLVRRIAYSTAVAVVGLVLGLLVARATLLPELVASPRVVLQIAMYFLVFLGLSMAVSLSITLWKRLEERVRADEDLRLARRIQSSFLPAGFSLPPAYDLHALNVPSRSVSGDFYDVVPAADGTLLLAVGDVSGKGVPAALLGSMLQAALRMQAVTAASAAAILAAVNRLVLQQQEVGRFATVFLARFDPARGRLVYSNAGHNPPLLWRRGGDVDALTVGGTVVGILPDQDWREEAVDLADGDLLALYTDGITEAAGPGGDMFGEERLRGVLGTLPAGLPSRDIAARVIAAVDAFTGGAPPDDDRTLMVMRVVAEPAA